MENKKKVHFNTTHGMSYHRLHIIWSKMKSRCNNPGRKDAKYYYNKGVKVCEEWQSSFISFMEWAMSHGYKDTLVIDRIKGNKGYTPGNCRWVTVAKNNRNKCSTKLTEKKVKEIRSRYKNEGMKQVILAKEYNISTSHLCSILKNKFWKDSSLSGGSHV